MNLGKDMVYIFLPTILNCGIIVFLLLEALIMK